MNLDYIKIGIAGIGFVGSSLKKSFELKNINIIAYDKFKNLNLQAELLECNIVFLCLPTLFNEELKSYDKSAIMELCAYLNNNNYIGLVVIKSTIEPETTDKLSKRFNKLSIYHNPEFLTARTAFEDFHNQSHIVLGKGPNCSQEDTDLLYSFYNKFYPLAKISLSTSLESESMKIMCNSFYASKIMLFNEYYLLCQKNGADYNKIVELMLENKWINPMHTSVPGPDGNLAYGGACFPKDTQALNRYMESYGSENLVLENVIKECKLLRKE